MILTGNINEVTRKVTFEQTSAVVAVVGDYDVNGVAFGFPASYEDDFDLSTGVKTVYYEATDGTIYNHVITDTDTDTGLPLWVFTDEINKGEAGTVKFAIVIDEVDSDANITKRWVSLITSFQVRQSIEIDTSEEEANEQTYSERLATLMTQVAAMQTVVDGLASGTPTAVSTVAEMTDTSLIYLYTGSEDGYTAGNWYYYNGSAWTSGGAYGNSSEVIAARTNADTGTTYTDLQTRLDTEYSEIKEDLGDLSELTTTDQSSLVAAINEVAASGGSTSGTIAVSITETSGFFGSNGGISSAGSTTQEVYTNRITVQSDLNVNYQLDYTTSRSMWLAYCTYDANGDFIARTIIINGTATSGSGTLTIASGVGEIAFCYRTYGESTFAVTFDAPTIDTTLTMSGVPSDAYVVGKALADIVDRQDTTYEATVSGYYNASGTLTSAGSTNLEVSTIKIPTAKNDIFTVSLSSESGYNYWVAVAFFDDDREWTQQTILQAAGTTLTSFNETFMIDSDRVGYIALSYRSYDAVTGAITKTHWLKKDNIIWDDGDTTPDGVPFAIETEYNVHFGDDTLDNTKWIDGYVTGDALSSSNSNDEMVNYQLIAVDDTKEYTFANTDSGWSTAWVAIAWYTDDSRDGYINRTTYTSTTSSLTVTPPLGAHYCCISSRNMSDYYSTATFEEVTE